MLIDVESITTQVQVHLTEPEIKRLELALMVTVDEFLNELPRVNRLGEEVEW